VAFETNVERSPHVIHSSDLSLFPSFTDVWARLSASSSSCSRCVHREAGRRPAGMGAPPDVLLSQLAVEAGRAARWAGRGTLGTGRAARWGGRTACHGLFRAGRRGRGGGTYALTRPRRRDPSRASARPQWRHLGLSAGEVAAEGPRAPARPRQRDLVRRRGRGRGTRAPARPRQRDPARRRGRGQAPPACR
jgi:hypothetical protein